MRKVFKPLNAVTNEKKFIGDDEPIEDGWHATPQEAHDAWKKRYPGRPKKAPEPTEAERLAAEVFEAVADRVHITRPTTLVGSTDDDSRTILSLTIEIGTDLMQAHPWQVLSEEATFSGLGQEEQTDVLPSDFDRFIPETMWNRTDNTFITGPVTPTVWQRAKGSGDEGVTKFAYRGNQVRIVPTIDAGDTIAYEFVSNQWVDTDGDGLGEASTWAADSDEPVFDEEMFTRGVVFGYLESKGLPSGVALEKFRRSLNRLIKNDRPDGRILSAGDIFSRFGRHGTGAP